MIRRGNKKGKGEKIEKSWRNHFYMINDIVLLSYKENNIDLKKPIGLTNNQSSLTDLEATL